MTNAVTQTFFINAGTTATAARDQVRDFIIANWGWTHVKSYLVGAVEYATFTVPSLTGFVSVRFDVSSGANRIGFSLHDTFNDATNARGGEVADTIKAVNNSLTNGSVVALGHPELCMFRASFGTTNQITGVLFFNPANKPANWNDAKPYAATFGAVTGTFSFGNTALGATSAVRLGVTAAQPDGRGLTRGVTFYAASSYFLGQTSDDLALIAASGANVWDTGTLSTGEVFTIVEPSSEALCIRTA